MDQAKVKVCEALIMLSGLEVHKIYMFYLFLVPNCSITLKYMWGAQS
jgi:hypothetical protein